MKKEDTMFIWRLTWSHTSGVFWMAIRIVEPENATVFLEIFRMEEPGATFICASKAPEIKPGDSELARHPATIM